MVTIKEISSFLGKWSIWLSRYWKTSTQNHRLFSPCCFKLTKLKGFHWFCSVSSGQPIWYILVETAGWVRTGMRTLTMMRIIVIIGKRKKGLAEGRPWPAFQNRAEFMCGRQQLAACWSVSVSAARISPWHTLKLRHSLPRHPSPHRLLCSTAQSSAVKCND